MQFYLLLIVYTSEIKPMLDFSFVLFFSVVFKVNPKMDPKQFWERRFQAVDNVTWRLGS